MAWLGIRGDNNADTRAHKQGVVLILSERLHSVSSQFDRLRARRFQDVINKALPRRKLAKLYKPADASGSNNCDSTEPERNQPDMGRVQQQYLDDETRALQAVEATKNVELGNKELSQAIQRNSSSRTFLLMFLFVLTFSVLFLDWYS
ncbi:unnamed protein product [Rhodiola kirilowii]